LRAQGDDWAAIGVCSLQLRLLTEQAHHRLPVRAHLALVVESDDAVHGPHLLHPPAVQDTPPVTAGGAGGAGTVLIGVSLRRIVAGSGWARARSCPLQTARAAIPASGKHKVAKQSAWATRPSCIILEGSDGMVVVEAR